VTDVETGTRMADWLEQAWLERYLARQLGAEERDWFEAYLLDKPELVGLIEVDSDLKDALSVQAATTALPALTEPIARPAAQAPDLEPRSGSGNTSVVSLKVPTSPRAARQPSSPRWFALAATVTLAIGTGWFASTLFRSRETNLGLVANPTRIVYDTMRGESTPPQVQHEASGSDVLLIEVGVPATAEHVLLEIKGRPSAPLAVSADGFVSFLLTRSTASKNQSARIRYQIDGREVVRNLDLTPPSEGAR